jgi:hypothetical protein
MKLKMTAGQCLIAVTVTLAAATLLTPAAVAAPAAGSRTWHITRIFSVASGASQLDSVDAVSAGDAWLAGETFPAAAGQAPVLVEHWSHGTWRDIPVPASVDPGNLTLAGDVIAGSSQANAWLFTGYQGVAGPFTVTGPGSSRRARPAC